MATIINNPSDTRPVMSEDTSSPVGMIVGLIVALVLIVLFVLYVLPSIQNGGAYNTSTPATPAGSSANLNVTVPSGTTDTTGGSSNGSGQTSGTVNSSASGY